MTLIKSISGIRGTIGGKNGDTLSPLDLVKFTSAFGTWVKNNSNFSKIVIGRDARPSGELITQIVASTLQAMGFEVIDLGLSTTPTVEIAVPLEEAGGGIIITASHNPSQWNALKLLNEQGEFLSVEASQEVLELADNEVFEYVETKKIATYQFNDSYLQKHIDLILALPLVDKEAIAQRNFKIILDCVNSTGGIFVPKLLEALGVTQITPLYCERKRQFRFGHCSRP
jgi:phosphomannomutase